MPRRKLSTSARSAPALPSDPPDLLTALEPSLAAVERFAEHGVPLPDGVLEYVTEKVAQFPVADGADLEEAAIKHGVLLAPALARLWACCARLPASSFAQLPPRSRCAWAGLIRMVYKVSERLLGDDCYAPARRLGAALLRGEALQAFSRQLAAATQAGLGYLQGPRAAGGASGGAAVAAPGQARGPGGVSGAAAATAHASGAAAGGRGTGLGGAAAAAAALLRSGEASDTAGAAGTAGAAEASGAADTAGAAEAAAAADTASAATWYASQQAELSLSLVACLTDLMWWQGCDGGTDEQAYRWLLLVALGDSPLLEHCARAVMLLAAHKAKQEGQGRGGAGGGVAAAAPGGPRGPTAAPAAAPAARSVVWSALHREGCICCIHEEGCAAGSAAAPQLSARTVFLLQRVLSDLYLMTGLSAASVAPAVSGPCVAYAALSFGLVALHLADGGPTPGLDPRLVRVLKEYLYAAWADEDGDVYLSCSLATFCGACKVWLSSHGDSASGADARWITRHMLRLVRAVLQQRAEGGVGVLVGSVVVAAAAGGGAEGGGAAVEGAGGGPAAGPAPRRGAGGGRAAAGSSAARGAGSARHGAKPGRPAEGGAAQHQQPRLVLAPMTSARLLASALDTALAAWAHRGARVRHAGDAGGPEQSRLGAELFGAAYRVADSGLMGAAGRGDASKLAAVLGAGLDGLPQEGPLPAALHAPNAAGLAAGLVPWLERYLRRECSKEEADGDLDVAQHLLLMLLHNLAEHGSSLVWPLVYGSPAHVRPLVATLRKLLLRMQAEGTRDRDPVLQDVPEYAVPSLLLVEASRAVLHALRDLAARPLPCDSSVADGPAAGGATGGGAQAAGAGRCMEQLSHALAQLLPAAAPLALQQAGWRLSKGAAEAVLSWVGVLWAAEDAVGRQQAQQQEVKPTGEAGGAAAAAEGGVEELPGAGGAAAAAEGAVAGVAGGVVGGAAAAAGARSTAAFLRPLLLELGVVRLLGAHMQRVVGEEAASSSGEEGDSEEEEGQGQRQAIDDKDPAGPGGVLRACCMVAQLFPQEVRAAAGGAAGVQQSGSGAGGSSSGRAGGGSSGGALGGDPTCPDGAPRVGEWRAEWVRELTSRVGAEGRLAVNPAVVRAGEQLASLLEAWASGRDGVSEAACALPDVSQARLRERHGGVAAQGLLPLTEARSLLRACSNPQCTSLQGDSEAGLQLQACARCGGPSYCCKGCQVAHWRAGHRDACARP